MLAKRVLEIFVDESGNFGDTRDSARYCVVTLVFHDADADLVQPMREYASGVFRLGADPETMMFHTAPLVRQEGQFSAMSRNMRGKIFYQMLSLVRKSDVRYRSFCIDTNYVASETQILSAMKSQVAEFVSAHHSEFSLVEKVRLYYDAGQKGVTRILESLTENCPCAIEFVQGVCQGDHLLLQVADFLCTVGLIERRIDNGQLFNFSEKKFFGSPRDFKRNVLRKLKAKEIS